MILAHLVFIPIRQKLAYILSPCL